MTSKITTDIGSAEFSQIVDLAIDHHDRFLVERDGEPAVIILSVSDFLNEISPTPGWMKKLQDEAERNGTSELTMAEIDAEVAAVRTARRERKSESGQ